MGGAEGDTHRHGAGHDTLAGLPLRFTHPTRLSPGCDLVPSPFHRNGFSADAAGIGVTSPIRRKTVGDVIPTYYRYRLLVGFSACAVTPGFFSSASALAI